MVVEIPLPTYQRIDEKPVELNAGLLFLARRPQGRQVVIYILDTRLHLEQSTDCEISPFGRPVKVIGVKSIDASHNPGGRVCYLEGNRLHPPQLMMWISEKPVEHKRRAFLLLLHLIIRVNVVYC